MTLNPSNDTVFVVNLSKSQDLNWKRIESLESRRAPSLIRFTYPDILSATRNFSKGRVGFMRTAVAIKRLDTDDKEASKAFCRELMIASSLHNPHIVPLLGFCMDAEMGFDLRCICLQLQRRRRYKAAIGIAEAINYLHNGTERCVVPRDIKPSNILVSSKKTPKAKPLLQQGGVEKLLDPRLGFTPKSMSQVARMARAAAACINNEMRRPEMGEIVTILKGKESTVLTRSKTLNSGATDSRRELLQTKTEMKNHFALAMLGVELEDEDSLNRW
ncbi:hypothetical protein SASPL_143869 [Salvia splendens]|uniref:Protein kinase domain-containing protein n=1 Tax=Salvia splendens TaxID=180675 RepID=A0A8X8WNH7_SALSN|nr:hypothetical protein SASPL_143869 [Salvia splendens]